ncbi:MAG: LCP family protein, partial [Turicibacter sp.]
TSIPRDSYVPIACFNNKKDKITHSNNGGTECVLDTVSNWLDVDIPYYVKINFKGFVELIDSVGGVYMYVPQTIVEQNSDREFGKDLVYVEKGYQLLNGEQALALARHRKTLSNGDLGRAESQQDVIKAVIAKVLTEFKSINEVLNVIEILGNNVETNISVNQITSSFQYALDTVSKYGSNNPMNYIHFKNMTISANYGGIYDLGYEKLLSYAFPFEGAVADAKENMMINLGLKKPEMKYTFNYNPHSVHFGLDWVKSYYNEPLPSDIPPVPPLVPNFVADGWTKDEVLKWGQQNGVKITINEITEGQSGFVSSAENGQVVSQSERAERPVSKVSSITVGVIKRGLNCSIAENQSAEECRNLMPDMVSLGYSAAKAKEWANSNGIPITVNVIQWNQSGYNPAKAGRVTAQSVKALTKASDMSSLTVDVMDNISVPDFNKLNWSKDQINSWASATSIKINYVDDKHSSVPQGLWAFNAEVGSILEPNSQLTVYKSKGPAQVTISSDYVGKSYNDFKAYIDGKNAELGLSISVVKKEVYDANV